MKKIYENLNEQIQKYEKSQKTYSACEYSIRRNNEDIYTCNEDDINILFYKEGIKEFRACSHFTRFESKDIDKILDNNDDVEVIELTCTYNKYDGNYPFFKSDFNSDIYINIKDYSYESYFSSLSKTTKKNLKWCLNKLKKEYDYRVEILGCDQISDDTFKRMIELKQQRFHDSKNAIVYEDIDWAIKHFRNMNGKFVIISLNDSIEAMVEMNVSYDQVFVNFCSYNTEYDKLSLGTISFLESIKWSFENDIQRYHFMYEWTPLKKHLGGVFMETFSYRIYKNKSFKYYLDYFKIKPLYWLRYQIKRNKKVRLLVEKVKKTKLMYLLEKIKITKLLRI